MAVTPAVETDAARSVTLRRAGVELVLDLASGYPVVLHWGAPLGDVDADALRALKDGGIPHSDLDEPVDPGMLRESARGFTGRPAIRGHRGATGFSPLFEVTAVTVRDDACTVALVDTALELSLELVLALSPEGVLLIDAALTNDGDTVYTLDELALWLPVPDRATETLDFTGRWLKERQPQRLAFAPGLRLRESREGRSGHDYTIVQCALTPTTTTEEGEAWGVGLLWSGSSRHLAERAVTGRAALGAGELIEPGEAELEPGATYRAPTLAAFYSDEGLDGVGARSHSWLRSRPSHPSTPRPVTLNVWEAVYFDHDLDTLSRLAATAASVGVERFVLDDGWFGSRRDDWSGLGDWVVSTDVWPDGLGPLVAAVREHGMQFGLWFEGEMVNPDSDVYRAHPDWILQVPGRVPPLARHQLVLDLTNPEAYAHVLEQVHAVISEHSIDYIKWDHNRFLTDPGHEGVPAVRRQTEALYRLFDELKDRNPGLEIESCASGGGRIDLGMAFHADRFWTSDQNDALERQQIQRWTSLVIPPEMLGTHVGPTISHGTGRRHGIQMRAVTALFGHAGIEWNLLEATEEELSALREWTAFYRAHRGLLHGGRVVRVEHPDPSAVVHGVVAHDRASAIFAYVQCTTTSGTTPASFRLPGLDPAARYRVRAEQFAEPATVQRRGPAWLDGLEVSGAALASVGLRPPVLWPEQAVLVVVERVS
ncbi:alpha-galactosidase [Demequina sp. SYSU T00039]|uniref:alpha-galactosidase n=1 Tax=Demequina lignilytica TaxID=3051663 RepID=A0AAW7M1K3_9MICO|nr:MULTISPECIES: alpha-galactosidase [unclassified Demequina]MDN4478551.1 alpha-galactosidase [Demequina sp. SYSU T00039-1]MDN4486942.1 alpha-galactosidase [Demequina sp. SYSU T00039]